MSALAAGCALRPGPDVESLRDSPQPRYWLGKEFEGLPITHIDDGFIVYGDCEPRSDTGCAPPLQLQHWELDSRHPDSFPRGIRCVRGRIAGNLVAAFSTSGGLEIYLGRTVVVMFADWKRMLRATRALRPISRSARMTEAPRDVVRAVAARCGPGLSRSPLDGS